MPRAGPARHRTTPAPRAGPSPQGESSGNMIRCGFAVVAVWGLSLPSPAQVPFDGTRLGLVRRGVPSAGRRLPTGCEAVRAGRPTSPGPPRWTCGTQTRWTIRRFERRRGSGCSSMAPICCFIRHPRRFQPQYPTRVQSPASATTRGPAATTGAACLCSVSEFTTSRGLGRGLRFLPRPHTYLMLLGDDFAPGRRWHHPGLTQHGVNSRIAGSRPRERRSPSSCHYVHRRSPLLG
jgi:hypothetical protein